VKKIICISAAALVLAAGCSKSDAVKSAPPAPVLTALAAVKNLPVLITPPPVGHVMPVSSVTIRPQIGGVISAVKFSEGQKVSQGDLLFAIDSRPAAATLARAPARRSAVSSPVWPIVAAPP
jgi:multidrug efflux pump subunit AcrA (membrane-fusion protein)